MADRTSLLADADLLDQPYAAGVLTDAYIHAQVNDQQTINASECVAATAQITVEVPHSPRPPCRIENCSKRRAGETYLSAVLPR